MLTLAVAYPWLRVLRKHGICDAYVGGLNFKGWFRTKGAAGVALCVSGVEARKQLV